MKQNYQIKKQIAKNFGNVEIPPNFMEILFIKKIPRDSPFFREFAQDFNGKSNKTFKMLYDELLDLRANTEKARDIIKEYCHTPRDHVPVLLENSAMPLELIETLREINSPFMLKFIEKYQNQSMGEFYDNLRILIRDYIKPNIRDILWEQKHRYKQNKQNKER